MVIIKRSLSMYRLNSLMDSNKFIIIGDKSAVEGKIFKFSYKLKIRKFRILSLAKQRKNND